MLKERGDDRPANTEWISDWHIFYIDNLQIQSKEVAIVQGKTSEAHHLNRTMEVHLIWSTVGLTTVASVLRIYWNKLDIVCLLMAVILPQTWIIHWDKILLMAHHHPHDSMRNCPHFNIWTWSHFHSPQMQKMHSPPYLRLEHILHLPCLMQHTLTTCCKCKKI